MIIPIKVDLSMRADDTRFDLAPEIAVDPYRTYRVVAIALDTQDGTLRKYEFESMRVTDVDFIGHININVLFGSDRRHLEMLRDELVKLLGAGSCS